MSTSHWIIVAGAVLTFAVAMLPYWCRRRNRRNSNPAPHTHPRRVIVQNRRRQ